MKPEVRAQLQSRLKNLGRLVAIAALGAIVGDLMDLSEWLVGLQL